MSEEVKKMFSNISKHYDLMNDVLSFGIHRLWRRKLIKCIELQNNYKILDCATGTGDLAFAFKKKLGADAVVIGTDFCQDMVDIAHEKAKQNNLDVTFMIADAMNLQINDSEFDVATISFGIRNVDDVAKALKEMARVVKHNGYVVILEFGQPTSSFFNIYKLMYDIYSKKIMPFIGKIITKDSYAYTYLPQTASQFPCRDKFIDIMNKTQCFDKPYYKFLTGGIAYIYIGKVRRSHE
jgi:demethylmenaquinone methyltransferase / 2-methoxy-6-polyprenyl-1,4-benzoquinol methylase